MALPIGQIVSTLVETIGTIVAGVAANKAGNAIQKKQAQKSSKK